MEEQNSQYQQIENYELLRSEVEAALKKKLCTPKDFEYLRERIYARLHTLVSRTTLMRLWARTAKKPSSPKARRISFWNSGD